MIIERRKPLTANVGLIGVGHTTYWGQFQGLLAEMHKKLDHFESKLKQHSVNVVKGGLVDDAASAYKTVEVLKAGNLDLLFIDMVTYATSSTFGIICREMTCPIVLVVLQPLDKLNYEACTTYMQLCNDDFCSVPEFTGVALRMGKKIPEVIIGHMEGDVQADKEVAQWCSVAHALHDLKHSRIGLMGHTLEAMLDMHTDPTACTRAFGAHVVMCEPDEIMAQYKNIVPSEIDTMKKKILSFFDQPDPVVDPITKKLKDEDLEMAARVGLALEKFIEAKQLDGMAYYYEAEEGSLMRKLVTNLIVGNSMLTAAGFPMCGEFDLKTCFAMLIFDRLGIGGSFAEFHPIDFARDTILVGHDGPHHLNVAHGKPVIRSLDRYHGKPGSGASVEFNLKVGPITMLSIGVKANGQFKFVVGEGESLEGKIPATGNTNTHGKFTPDVRTFLKRWVAEGPTHHFALGIGHHAHNVKRVADALGIECVIVAN